MINPAQYDLVMLVPGKDEKAIFDGLLSSRQISLGIRNICYEILVHPRRDPGCFKEATEMLQPYQKLARYSMVVLDYIGSGQESRSPNDIKADLKGRLERCGWANRSDVLVFEPELEIWIWSDSPEVDQAIGWKGHCPPLRTWLTDRGLLQSNSPKPSQPKESLNAALKEVRMHRSSAIYRQLAEKVGLDRCRDKGFMAFQRTMRSWFA